MSDTPREQSAAPTDATRATPAPAAREGVASALAPTPHVVRRGSGAPLLLLHGHGVDHRLLLPLDDALRGDSDSDGDEKWERLYLDLPGFGETPTLGEPGGLPELVAWVDAAVGTLVGEAPFAVLGHSLGGLLAREVMARRAAQAVGVALLAPVVDPRKDHRSVPERTVLDADEELLAELDEDEAKVFEDQAVVQTPAVWDRFREHALPGIHAVDKEALKRLEDRYELDGELPEARSEEFVGPTLIVAGRQDHVVGFEDQLGLADHFTRASVAVLDRAGHHVHLDQPAAVDALLRVWSVAAAEKL